VNLEAEVFDSRGLPLSFAGKDSLLASAERKLGGLEGGKYIKKHVNAPMGIVYLLEDMPAVRSLGGSLDNKDIPYGLSPARDYERLCGQYSNRG